MMVNEVEIRHIKTVLAWYITTERLCDLHTAVLPGLTSSLNRSDLRIMFTAWPPVDRFIRGFDTPAHMSASVCSREVFRVTTLLGGVALVSHLTCCGFHLMAYWPQWKQACAIVTALTPIIMQLRSYKHHGFKICN